MVFVIDKLAKNRLFLLSSNEQENIASLIALRFSSHTARL